MLKLIKRKKELLQIEAPSDSPSKLTLKVSSIKMMKVRKEMMNQTEKGKHQHSVPKENNRSMT